jgi:hypothetical protein
MPLQRAQQCRSVLSGACRTNLIRARVARVTSATSASSTAPGQAHRSRMIDNPPPSETLLGEESGGKASVITARSVVIVTARPTPTQPGLKPARPRREFVAGQPIGPVEARFGLLT